MSKSNRTHVMHHELLRTRIFSSAERSVFAYINSYSTVCRPGKLEFMAKALCMSERHLRRVLRSLQLKGLIKRLYGLYKRIRIILASWDEQNRLWQEIKTGRTMLVDKYGNKVKGSQSAEEVIFWQMLKNAASQPRKIFRKKSYRTQMSEPILEENNLSNNIKTKTDEMLQMKAIFTPKRETDESLQAKAARQIEALYQLMPHLRKN